MKDSITVKIWVILLACLISAGVGYYFGHQTVEIPKTETKTKTIIGFKLSPFPVHDTIIKPVPYAVYTPVEIWTDTAALFAHWAAIYMTDTVGLYSVWNDYYTIRDYKLDFSHDTIGTFKVDARISENKLLYATSVIQPVYKTYTTTNTVYKVPLLQLWGMVGTSPSFDTNKLQLGLDWKGKYMFGVSGYRIDKTLLNKPSDLYTWTVDVGYKF